MREGLKLAALAGFPFGLHRRKEGRKEGDEMVSLVENGQQRGLHPSWARPGT
jgi:hypothetical protein